MDDSESSPSVAPSKVTPAALTAVINPISINTNEAVKSLQPIHSNSKMKRSQDDSLSVAVGPLVETQNGPKRQRAYSVTPDNEKDSNGGKDKPIDYDNFSKALTNTVNVLAAYQMSSETSGLGQVIKTALVENYELSSHGKDESNTSVNIRRVVVNEDDLQHLLSTNKRLNVEKAHLIETLEGSCKNAQSACNLAVSCGKDAKHIQNLIITNFALVCGMITSRADSRSLDDVLAFIAESKQSTDANLLVLNAFQKALTDMSSDDAKTSDSKSSNSAVIANQGSSPNSKGMTIARSVINTLRGDLKDTMSKLSKVESDLMKKNEEVERLTGQTQELSRTKATVEMLQSRLEQLANEIVVKDSMLVEKDQLLQSRDSTITNLQSQSQTPDDFYPKLEATQRAYKSEMEKLTAHYQKLFDDITHAKNGIQTSYENNVAELCANHQKQIDILADENIALNEEVKNLKRELQFQLLEKNELMITSSNHISVTEDAIEDLMVKELVLKDECALKDSDVREMIAVSECHMEATQDIMQDLKTENMNFKHTIETKNDQIVELEQELLEEISLNEDLNSKLTLIEMNFEELRQISAEQTRTIETYVMEVENSSTQLSSLSGDLIGTTTHNDKSPGREYETSHLNHDFSEEELMELEGMEYVTPSRASITSKAGIPSIKNVSLGLTSLGLDTEKSADETNEYEHTDQSMHELVIPSPFRDDLLNDLASYTNSPDIDWSYAPTEVSPNISKIPTFEPSQPHALEGSNLSSDFETVFTHETSIFDPSKKEGRVFPLKSNDGHMTCGARILSTIQFILWLVAVVSLHCYSRPSISMDISTLFGKPVPILNNTTTSIPFFFSNVTDLSIIPSESRLFCLGESVVYVVNKSVVVINHLPPAKLDTFQDEVENPFPELQVPEPRGNRSVNFGLYVCTVSVIARVGYKVLRSRAGGLAARPNRR